MSKSPFIDKKETYTYKYPEPFTVKKEEELASQVESDGGEFIGQIDYDELEGGHWITIRIPKSRGDVDAVADRTQSMMVVGDNGDGTRFERQIARGNREIFELLAEDWSFDRECNGANYSLLGDWSGEWISACLGDAVNKGTNRDFAKKTRNSYKQQETSEQQPSEPQQAESVSQ